MRLLLATGLFVLACQSAQASVTDTLIHSGKCKTASNWSLGNPSPYDAYVPAGKVLKAESTTPCAMRSLDDEGTVAGFGPITVGNSLRAEGPAGQDVALKISGSWLDSTGLKMMGSYLGSPQILDMGSSQVSNFVIEGPAHYELGEPARFESLWTMQEGTSFDTAGYDIGGMGDTQVGLPATLKLHGSEWDTGEWRVAASVALEAGEATVYQDDGSYGITECHGQTLGNLIVENFRPHLRDNCTIPGTLALNQTADHSPIVFAGAFLPDERTPPTFHLGTITSNGTTSQPVVTEGHATIVLPHDEEVTGYLDPSDWTVEGGTLYIPNGTGAADSGVVFAPEP